MATGSGSTGRNTTGWITAGAAVTAVVAAGLYYAGVFAPQPEPSVVTSDTTPKVATPVAQPDPEPTPETAVVSADPAPTAADAEATADAPATPTAEPLAESSAPQDETVKTLPALMAPTFDVVRVDPEGSTVIAGTGPAGSIVSIFVDGEKRDMVRVDSNGKFASLLFLGESDDARLLTLEARLDAQSVESDDQIILAPSRRVVTEPVVVAEANIKPEPAPTSETAPTAEPEAQAAPETKTEPEADAASAPASAPVADVVAKVETIVAPETGAATETATETAVEAVAETVVETVAEPETVSVPDPVAEPAEVADSAPTDVTAPASEVVAEVEPVAEPQPAVAETISETATAAVDAPEPVTESAALTEPAATEPEPAPIAVLRADAEGVELLQPATAATSAEDIDLVLETIGYSDTGDVLLSGRATPNAVIRVYLDNNAIADLVATNDGRWRGKMDGIVPGLYTLRLDAIDANGAVLSRVETPFIRENPDDLRAPETAASSQAGDGSETSPENRTPPIRVITVQTGDTLWAISRERYGDGVLYVKVFDANRHHIRDPDLIYPGQVFEIPDE